MTEILSKERIESLKTIKMLTSYDNLNVFYMETMYDYNLNNLTPYGVHDNQKLLDLILDEAFPGIQVEFEAPSFGCSAFSLKKNDNGYFMGRNYDFKFDTSAMIVYCHPKDGYKSIAHTALDNVNVVNPFESNITRAACLTSPFTCLDGINEKGVGIAVLTLSSNPTCQDTGKRVLATPLIIRLVLDKASSTAEAIELIKEYDIFATSGRDYHFFITDNTGDSRVVEFDCNSPTREMIVTPTRTVTNFYIAYKDELLLNNDTEKYGHGVDRYDAIEKIINDNNGTGDYDVALEALKAASQEPNPEVITSNTQWSIAYDLDNLSYKFVLHRHWDNILFVDTLKNNL